MAAASIDIYKLRNASRKLLREWGVLKLAYQHKLFPSRAHTLLEIKAGSNSISSLSERLILDISTVSRIIDKLSKDGLVICKKSSGKRVKTISLSTKGELEVKRIDAFSDKLITDAFSFVPKDEQETILRGKYPTHHLASIV